MAETFDFRDTESHVLSFHQTKALCLIALLINHAGSFSCLAMQIPIVDLPFGAALQFISFYNALFIMIAGITTRLMLSPFFEGDRLRSGGFKRVFDPLLGLVVIEVSRNLIMFDSLAFVFGWDFIKTIFFGFIACYLVARIQIQILPILAFVISWFFASIHEWLIAFERQPEISFIAGPHWSSVQTATVVLVGVLLGYVSLKVLIRKPPFLGVVIWTSFVWFVLCQVIARLNVYDVDLLDHQIYRNWLIWGLVGDEKRIVLFPFLVYAPTFILGFWGSHMAVTRQRFFMKLDPRVVLLSSLAVAGVFWALMLSWMFSVVAMTPATWTSLGMVQGSFSSEIFKVALFAAAYSAFYLLNRYNLPEWFHDFSTRMSQSSFWIYILVNCLGPLIVDHLLAFTNSIYLVSAGALFVMFLLSDGLSRLIRWLGSRRIKLVFDRGGP